MGRPCMLTPDRHARIVALVRKGMTYDLVAACAGISYETLRVWLHTGHADDEAGRETVFAALYVAVRAQEHALLETSLDHMQTAMEKGDQGAIRWWLNVRYPRVFGNTPEPRRELDEIIGAVREAADKIGHLDEETIVEVAKVIVRRGRAAQAAEVAAARAQGAAEPLRRRPTEDEG